MNTMTEADLRNCPDCAVKPGTLHEDGCDVARCANSGVQRLQCDCDGEPSCNTTWTGRWPGDVECEEFGWWVRWTDHGWEKCSADTGGATEDLNRLVMSPHTGETVWDRNAQRYVRRG